MYGRVKNPPPGSHSSNEWAGNQANPSEFYPAVYEITATPKGGSTNHQIKATWWDYTRRVNLLMGTTAGWEKAKKIWSGWLNSAANPEYAPGTVLSDNPDPLPKVEGIITVHNYVKEIERKNGAVRIELFDYLKPPPNILDVNPMTHPQWFDQMHSVNAEGDVGNAPEGEVFYFPRLAKNGIGWIPEDILEIGVDLPTYRPLTAPPVHDIIVGDMKGLGLHIWIIESLYRGDIQKIISEAKAAGAVRITAKHYDYTINKSGLYDKIESQPALLHELSEACRANGIQFWVWYYPHIAREGPQYEAEQVARLAHELNAFGIYVDAEAPWMWKKGDKIDEAGKRSYAREHFAALRAHFHGPIAFTSFRNPSFVPNFPWRECVKAADYHLPQVYFEQAHRPEFDLERSMAQFADYGLLHVTPYLPMWPAYSERGWVPTQEDIVNCYAVTVEKGMPGCDFWRWEEAVRHNLFSAIKDNNPFRTDPPKVKRPPWWKEKMERLEDILTG